MKITVVRSLCIQLDDNELGIVLGGLELQAHASSGMNATALLAQEMYDGIYRAREELFSASNAKGRND